MPEILTVCTGNICRSPLAEALLRTRLADRGLTIHSAGTYGMEGEPMTPEAQRVAAQLGVPDELAAAHRARYLQERMLVSPDLILAMSREHRRRVVELAPSKLRAAFTVREFARLAQNVGDDAVMDAAGAGGSDARARLRAAVQFVAAQRGLVLPPDDRTVDDVIDPYRKDWSVYVESAGQLAPAIDQVVRIVEIAIPA